MKKLGYLLIIMVILVACTPEQKDVDVTKTSTTMKTTSTTKPEKNILSIGETATTRSGSKLTVTKFEDPAVVSYSAESGNRFLAVEIEQCRGDEKTSETSSSVFAFELKLNDSSRKTGSFGREPELNESRYEPGECIKGWVTFEAPVEIKAEQLIFTYLDSSTNKEVTLRWQIS